VSQNVPLGSDAHLLADMSYGWTVRWWDKDGAAAPVSAVATFSTGLLASVDWAGAAWIGGKMGQYRREFSTAAVQRIRRAVVYIVGLGYYKLHVNGEQVSDHELGPFTTFEERCLYDTVDVTQQLSRVIGSGGTAHVIGVTLGDGWFSQLTVNIGPPRLLLRLSIVYEDGSTESVVSDSSGGSNSSWFVSDGLVTAVDMYAGEVYNASLETPGWTTGSYVQDPARWSRANASAPPSGRVKLTSHAVLPPIRISETRSPVALWSSGPGQTTNRKPSSNQWNHCLRFTTTSFGLPLLKSNRWACLHAALR